MALSAADRLRAARFFIHRVWRRDNATSHTHLGDILAAVISIDDTFDALASTLNQAQSVKQNFNSNFPEPFKSRASVEEKAKLVGIVVLTAAGILDDF